jgi:hypothetical protein
MIILTLLPWIFIVVFVLVVLLMILREIRPGRPSRHYAFQREVDLRLTYKRYMEIYPGTKMSYEEYKKMQRERAYKKAVSSTKIKRMVR